MLMSEFVGRDILNFDFSEFVNEYGYDFEICTKCTNILYEFFLKYSYSEHIQGLLFVSDYEDFYCVYYELFIKVYECIIEGRDVEYDKLNKEIVRWLVYKFNDKLVNKKRYENDYSNRYIPYFEGKKEKFYIIDKKM